MAFAKNTISSMWVKTTACMYFDHLTVNVERAILTTAMAKCTNTLHASRIFKVSIVPKDVANGSPNTGR